MVIGVAEIGTLPNKPAVLVFFFLFLLLKAKPIGTGGTGFFAVVTFDEGLAAGLVVVGSIGMEGLGDKAASDGDFDGEGASPREFEWLLLSFDLECEELRRDFEWLRLSFDLDAE